MSSGNDPLTHQLRPAKKGAKIIRPEAVDFTVRKLKDEGFYGDLMVRFRDGEIVLVQKIESFVDESQLYE